MKLRTFLFAGLLAITAVAQAKNGQPSISDFESGLAQYPAGYVLYAKLDAERKQTVYGEFLKAEETKRYQAALRKVIELGIQ